MKALIRHEGETVLETAGIEGIDWTTGAPLTNPSWAGGAYALCLDSPPDALPSDFDITSTEVVVTEATEDTPAETVTRLIATLNQERYDARKQQETEE